MTVTAENVIFAVQNVIADRIANQPYNRGDWTSFDAANRYESVEKSLAVWRVSSRSVVVSVVDTSDGHLWGHICSEVLDQACNEIEAFPFDTGMIDQPENRSYAILSW